MLLLRNTFVNMARRAKGDTIVAEQKNCKPGCELGVIRNIVIICNRRYFVQRGDMALVGKAVRIEDGYLRLVGCDMFSMLELAVMRTARSYRFMLLDVAVRCKTV